MRFNSPISSVGKRSSYLGCINRSSTLIIRSSTISSEPMPKTAVIDNDSGTQCAAVKIQLQFNCIANGIKFRNNENKLFVMTISIYLSRINLYTTYGPYVSLINVPPQTLSSTSREAKNGKSLGLAVIPFKMRD